MNLIGKIFVLLILVMSLMFASFAIAVYGTHENWRTKAQNLQTSVDAVRQDLQKAQDEQAKLVKQIDDEAKAKREALAKLETAKTELQTQRDSLAKERDALMVKDQVAVAALDVAQQNLTKLTKEVEVLRGEIRAAQSERDKHFEKVVELTDRIHQAQGELKRLTERNVQLAGQVAAADKVLSAHGLTKDTPVDHLPPQVRGKVLAVNRDNLIEISLGSDDGLREGHTLEVFRGSKYLGRVEVLHASSDRAVGKVLPGFKKGIIQKDDDVATRFKVS
jgi:predicted nuclease with TOPRIM domain